MRVIKMICNLCGDEYGIGPGWARGVCDNCKPEDKPSLLDRFCKLEDEPKNIKWLKPR